MNSSYNLEFPQIGSVKVTKKRGMRSIRMRISPKGEVYVSAPWSVPKAYVASFIRDRQDWIVENTASSKTVFRNGMRFGTGTSLFIQDGGTRNHSSIRGDGLHIKLAGMFSPSDKDQQAYIEKKIISAMQNQAENTLLPRLYELSKHFSHPFNQAYVKRLSSRWGSCDQDKNITLNVFLVQLPQDLQDYVMLHELTHTKFMNHSPAFWAHMRTLVPNVAGAKKRLKAHHPRVEPLHFA